MASFLSIFKKHMNSSELTSTQRKLKHFRILMLIDLGLVSRLAFSH